MRSVDLVVLAGFMRVLKGDFLRAFEGRIVNIHPSLLPCFPGLERWKQALDHGVKVAGCTVHFVDAGVDSGAIIGQQAVPVLDDDTAESLHQRIHAAEHELYPQCVAALARREISVVGRRVIWKNIVNHEASFHSAHCPAGAAVGGLRIRQGTDLFSSEARMPASTGGTPSTSSAGFVQGRRGQD